MTHLLDTIQIHVSKAATVEFQRGHHSSPYALRIHEGDVTVYLHLWDDAPKRLLDALAEADVYNLPEVKLG